MGNTELTEQQKTKILTRCLLTTKLKVLDMRFNNCENVETGLRTQAEQIIENLLV